MSDAAKWQRPLATLLLVAVIAGLALHYVQDSSGVAPLMMIAALLVAIGVVWFHGSSAQSDDAPELAAANPETTLHQLAKERDAAIVASEAKSRYLANVSHEIRSPLNAIYGYSQLMERGTTTVPRDAARIIRRSAEHLSDLVEGLLDISLVEHGQTRVASDVVRLPAFLEHLEQMFRPQAEAKGLRFVNRQSGRIPEFVRTDQKRLRQVLINLLANAVKFTEEGEIELALSFGSEVATFEVRDTGPGVPASSRERIFIPFERGTGAVAHAEGAGLGRPCLRSFGFVRPASRPDATGAGCGFKVGRFPQVLDQATYRASTGSWSIGRVRSL